MEVFGSNLSTSHSPRLHRAASPKCPWSSSPKTRGKLDVSIKTLHHRVASCWSGAVVVFRSRSPWAAATAALHRGSVFSPQGGPLSQVCCMTTRKPRRKPGLNCYFFGARDRIRTYDLLLRRQTLYPLSYAGGRVSVASMSTGTRLRRGRDLQVTYLPAGRSLCRHGQLGSVQNSGGVRCDAETVGVGPGSNQEVSYRGDHCAVVGA